MSRGLKALKEHMSEERKRHYAELKMFGGAECYLTMPLSIKVTETANAYMERTGGGASARMFKVLQQVLRYSDDGAPCIPLNEEKEFRKILTEEKIVELVHSFPELSDEDMEDPDHDKLAEDAKKNSVTTLSKASNS